jgi:hypothetical protein
VPCRAFDRSGKGALNFEEFYQLHSFMMQTQGTFLSLAKSQAVQYISRAAVSQALQQAGVRTATSYRAQAVPCYHIRTARTAHACAICCARHQLPRRT